MSEGSQIQSRAETRPALHKITLNAVEVSVILLLLALGTLVFNEALRLGPGWSYAGPQPGFFPFIMVIMMIAGALGALSFCIFKPDRRPCFEASHEVVHLTLVGAPILLVILAMPWLGLYIASGVYLALFMIFYGKFRWWAGLLGGVILTGSLWFFLVKVLSISMPMSVFYRSGVLPL